VSSVRARLEYANSVWYPKRKTDIDKLEQVQKRSTKLIPELSNKPYSDRLKILIYLHLNIDIIEVIWIELFKTNKGMYDPTCVPHFDFIELSEDSIN